MFFKNKFFISGVLFFMILFSSSNQVLTSNAENYFSIQSNQKSNALTGNVTVVIYNLENYYTSNQINLIQNYVYNVIQPTFSTVNFNVSILNFPQQVDFVYANALDSIVSNNNPNYLIILGGTSNGQSIYSMVKNWITGTNNINIKQLALVDNMITKSDLFNNPNPQLGIHFNSDDKIVNDLSVVNVDLSQAGFMSGVQSSLLTKTDKIGLIIDHSLKVDFNNILISPSDAQGSPYYSFNRADFVTGFIAGVEYGAEFLLDGAHIDLKSVSYDDSTSFSANVMNSDVATLSDFGADVIFNMESGLNSAFLNAASSHSIQTGTFGYNNTNASFSFIENSQNIVYDLVNHWNTTSTGVDWTYNLANSSIMSLSSMKDSSLSTIQTEILNGTIKIPNYISQGKIQGIPGFELPIGLVTLALVISKRKIKK